MSGLAARSGFAAIRRLGAFFDVVDHVADGLQFFSIFVRHFDGKFLFERHHQFHDIERIGAQVLDNDACGVTCSGFTPSCSTMMSLTFSSIVLSAIKNFWVGATLTPHAAASQVKELAKIPQPNATVRSASYLLPLPLA